MGERSRLMRSVSPRLLFPAFSCGFCFPGWLEIMFGLKQHGMADLVTTFQHLGALGWAAFRAFAGTLVLFIAAGLVVAATSYYWLKDKPLYAGIFAAVAFAEAI